MNIWKIIGIISKSYRNSKQYQLYSIKYEQIAQAIKVSSNFTDNLKRYVTQIKPFTFIWKIIRVFTSSIVLYLFLNVIDVGFSIGLTFINKSINQQMKNQVGIFNWGVLIIFIQVLGIKLFTSSLLIWKYVLEGQIAAKIFAYQISNISNLLHLKNSTEVSGEKVNFVEDDSEKISKLPYLISHTILLPTQVIVLSTLLAIYLPSDMSYFLGLIVIFVVICVLIGYYSYSINQGLMNSKDKRIQSNLTGQDLILHRNKQVKRVKQYLILNLVVQLIAQIGYSTLFIVIFWAGQDSMTKDDKYTALMLMNLLKSPMQRLTQIGLQNMDNYNSLQRISKGTHKSQETSTDSLLTDQSKQDYKPAQRTGKINILSFVKRKAVLEVGNVKLSKIYQIIREGISLIPFIGLFACFLISIGVNIFSHFASQSVISQKFHPQIIIPIVLTNFSLIALTGTSIFISLKISKFATKKMSKVSSYEVLNRYSGDIRILDRSTCTDASTFLNVSGVFIGTLVYTLISLQDLLIQALFFILVIILIYIAYRINRYAMWSRRQLRRMQCLKKAQLIARVTNADQHEKVLEVCKQLYVLKVVGIVVQAYIISSALIVSIVVCLLIICLCLSINLPEATTLILLNFLMGMDNNIKILLLNGLNLQICLVSVQRCLNASKLQSKSIEKQQDQRIDIPLLGQIKMNNDIQQSI